MKTNFFSQIAGMGIQSKINLILKSNEDATLTVSLLIQAGNNGDEAAKLIPPLTFTNTPESLDEGFFTTINDPIQQTDNHIRNMEAFLKGREEALKQSKMEQEKQVQRAKAKKKLDDAMKKVDELEANKLYGQAIGQMPTPSDFPDFEEEIQKRLTDLRNKHSQRALF